MWPIAMGLVVLAGVALIVVSAGGRGTASAGPILGDHWHAAYGIDTCGEWRPPLSDIAPDTSGLHTHQDGLIHIHPISTSYTRDDATLNAWGEVTGLSISEDSLSFPGGSFDAGDDCDGEPGAVQVMVWDGPEAAEGLLLEEDPGSYVPADGEIITIAFRPEGATLEKPPTVPRLQDPTAPEEGRPLVPIGPEAPEGDAPEGDAPEGEATEGGETEDPEASETSETSETSDTTTP